MNDSTKRVNTRFILHDSLPFITTTFSLNTDIIKAKYHTFMLSDLNGSGAGFYNILMYMYVTSILLFV